MSTHFEIGDHVKHVTGKTGKVIDHIPGRKDLPKVRWDGRKTSEPVNEEHLQPTH